MTSSAGGGPDADELSTSRWRRTDAQLQASKRAKWRRAPLADTIVYIQAGGVVAGDVTDIYLALRNDSRLPHTQHVWMVKSEARARAVRSAWGDHERTAFVIAKSDAAIRTLSTATTVVTDDTVPLNFSKRAGQRVVNTGSGAMARVRFGADLRRREDLLRLRALLIADAILVPDAGAANAVSSGWRLAPIWMGALVPVGAPSRTSPRLSYADTRLVDMPSHERPLVVIALGAEGRTNPRTAATELAANLECDMAAEAVIATVDLPFAARDGEPSAKHVLPGRPTDAALATARVVVTDDSGFIPRSPSQTVMDASDASAVALRTSLATGTPESPAPTHGDATSASVVASVHQGTWLPPATETADGEKPRVLIHLGAMNRNGITTAALNLLASIDYERLDVTAHVATAHSDEQVEAIARIDPRARLLLTPPGRAIAYERVPLRHWLGRVLPPSRRPSFAAVRRSLEGEWSRVFGGATFDSVADFSGYSPWYAGLMVASNAVHRTIWMHNDLIAEAKKVVEGERPHQANLRQTFSLYPHFDVVAAVSKSLADASTRLVESRAPGASLMVVPNLLVPPTPRDVQEARQAERAQVAASASASETWAAGAARFLDPDDPSPRILAAGRLSPEKNHARLLAALADPRLSTSIAVVLGDGPLLNELEALALRLGIADRVTFARHRPSVYPYLERASCLAVSSDHEGLPMAILEARMFGVPVVACDFTSAREAVPPEAGLVVERSASGLADGLAHATMHSVDVDRVDFASHNRESMQATLAALGLDT